MIIPETKKTVPWAITINLTQWDSYIEIYDKSSWITFLTIQITAQALVWAMWRLAHVPCLLHTNWLSVVWKNMEHMKFEFEVDWFCEYSSRVWNAQQIAKKLCPEWWQPDLWFWSQDSFFKKDWKSFAQTTIRRYV